MQSAFIVSDIWNPDDGVLSHTRCRYRPSGQLPLLVQ